METRDKSARRGLWLLVLLALAIPLLPWVAVGRWLEPWIMEGLSRVEWLRAHPGWSAGGGIALLGLDSFLPVPSTLVMSTLGYACGLLAGGLAASLGLLLSGTLCYGACKRFGRRAALRIAGPSSMEKMERFLRAQGPVLVAATRAIPVFQEASACIAGLAGMPAPLFFRALLLGSLPTGFVYASIGALAPGHGVLALGLSILVPSLSWVALWLWHRRTDKG
jgi:uncharacterized membrane protein YdjX (TVP38/TMEM64 family)